MARFVIAGTYQQFRDAKMRGEVEADAFYVGSADRLRSVERFSTIKRIGTWYERTDLAAIEEVARSRGLVLEDT
jgi:hypothetical protein